MKNLTTYLFLIFMIMFWIFRIIVVLCSNLGIDFIITPMDANFEVVLIFLTFLSMLFIVKRSMLGGLIYLAGNGLYFGTSIFNSIVGDSGINYVNIFFDMLGIILPILIVFDLLLDHNRKEHPVDKKTDWFFKNKDFDRKLDERADKNQYKF